METHNPTNGELALMIEGLRRETLDHALAQTAASARIETKVDHTNGRVRKLEQWKYAMIGGMIFANLILVPIIVKFFSKAI